MRKNSSKSSVTKNLAKVPAGRAKKFLFELANMIDKRVTGENLTAVEVFERQYENIIPPNWRLSTHRKLVKEIQEGPDAFYINTE